MINDVLKEILNVVQNFDKNIESESNAIEFVKEAKIQITTHDDIIFQLQVKYNNFLEETLSHIFIFNISSNKIAKILYLINDNFLLINYSPFSKLFISEISFSINYNDNLRKVNPVENISLFSGLNIPDPDY